MIQVRSFRIDELQTGMFCSFEADLGKNEVKTFAELTGDISPLHIDTNYGEATPYGTNLIHGMLAASHFSTLIGVLLPGRAALINSVQFEFVKPIPVDSTVVFSAKIIALSRVASTIRLSLVALRDGEVTIKGEASVTVRSEQTH